MQNYLLPEDDGLIMRPSGKWVEIKLDYLARYINVFETAMRNKWRFRNYIDLMSGPGKDRIRKTGQVVLGSPLIALTTQYPFTSYFFVDLDDNNTNALRQRCSGSPHSSAVTIVTGDCNQEVRSIVSQLKPTENNSLNLAFLDPQGLEIEWHTVEQLASIRRMDLILNYPQNPLSRYMKQAYESPKQTKIDRFFGGREWREIYKNRSGRKGLHRNLMDFYKEKLQGLRYKEIIRDDETGDEPLIRNAKRNAPLYRLLFASKHNLGFDFWQKITCRDAHGQQRLF